jgi:hypothetical protein
MKMLALAALAALTLMACGTMNAATANRSPPSAPAATQYWLAGPPEHFRRQHVCILGREQARCVRGETQLTSLEAARVTAPRKSSLCANGQWLVEGRAGGC